ncbi:hypothetical protein PISMIDRAFT_671631 [Pisolithus microcarpus 441]|uniref:Uncharacterized protein n=1 Tax=Pisolithus microcarpus 441 TaxID=765257 RepID=A0A0C9YX48_9AGAM|nr:hypothetical protein PISMIDRAFT_671631 [Pisolithus microcarpus 441]
MGDTIRGNTGFQGNALPKSTARVHITARNANALQMCRTCSRPKPGSVNLYEVITIQFKGGEKRMPKRNETRGEERDDSGQGTTYTREKNCRERKVGKLPNKT